MIFQRETLFDIIEEVGPLLESHYQECGNPRVKLNPRWDQYAALERMGMYAVFTVRSELELAGYCAFFLSHHMQHADMLSASNDVIYMKPEHRRGMNAIRFIDFCEQELKALGAQAITYHVKTHIDWRPILHKRGYGDEEVAVVKLL